MSAVSDRSGTLATPDAGIGLAAAAGPPNAGPDPGAGGRGRPFGTPDGWA